ncbi:hypothetical protein [Diaphorobacter caeni]|uniref:hypothetical protein n=1 Tax=Diaphorobacter caeni TaxID=2784387 RepID=UPI00188DDA39|nr:hypothetical protein [Diaphorobacter caeni]MBF5004755.1 hypothetical protein [Diaphorobacter caeni]
MERDTSTHNDESIEGFFRYSDTWKALTALLRIGARQDAFILTKKNPETGELTLLSADWQAASPQELAVIHRWAKKRAVELACGVGQLLEAIERGDGAPDHGMSLQSWVRGHLDLWVALTLLADHVAPLIADYHGEEA